MSTFQRMVVIPQEEYLSLKSMQNVHDPLARHFHNLEKRYNEAEKEGDDYRQMIMQSNTLNEMKQVKDQMRNSLAVSTPKPYLNRANALFQNLESFLKFNEKGEIYSEGGNLIPGSRLEDLIQHAVRDRRRNITPKGWSDFLNILRDHNVPKSILNHDTLNEMEDYAAMHVAPPPSGVKRKRPTSPSNKFASFMPLTAAKVKSEPSKQRSPSFIPIAITRGRRKPRADFNTDIKFLRNFKNE